LQSRFTRMAQRQSEKQYNTDLKPPWSLCLISVVAGVNFVAQCITRKGKAVPLQAWSGPEGSKKLRFPDYMTTAQYGGKVVSLTYRPPVPQEMPLVLISVRGW
jgi:hypothetical protein